MMRLAEQLVLLASATLPATARARYREQWMADLRDADELDIRRSGIVLGAFSFAAAAVSRELLNTEMSTSRSWRQLGIAVLVVAVPLLLGVVSNDLAGGFKVVLRDNFDVYQVLINTPLTLVFPVLVVLLSCLRFYREIGHRYVSNTRVRVRVGSYVFAKFLLAGGTSFVVFFLFAFVPFVIAFYLWPTLGNPSVDASAYSLTTSTALADSFERTTYSSLLEHGTMTYGVAYSAWVGFSASIYASLGIAALLVVKNRVCALAIPFLVYFGETVIAAVIGYPQAGLVYSTFPFGLSQTSFLAGAAPTLVLAVLTGILCLVVLRRVHRIENLA